MDFEPEQLCVDRGYRHDRSYLEMGQFGNDAFKHSSHAFNLRKVVICTASIACAGCQGGCAALDIQLFRVVVILLTAIHCLSIYNIIV